MLDMNGFWYRANEVNNRLTGQHPVYPVHFLRDGKWLSEWTKGRFLPESSPPLGNYVSVVIGWSPGSQVPLSSQLCLWLPDMASFKLSAGGEDLETSKTSKCVQSPEMITFSPNWSSHNADFESWFQSVFEVLWVGLNRGRILRPKRCGWELPSSPLPEPTNPPTR